MFEDDLEIFSFIISLDRNKFVTPDKMFIKNTGIREGEFYLEVLSYIMNVVYFEEKKSLLIKSDWKKSVYHPINIFVLNHRKELFKNEYNKFNKITDEQKNIIIGVYKKYKNFDQNHLLDIIKNDYAFKNTKPLDTIDINSFVKKLSNY